MDEFTITISGRGGHSAYPHLTRDPVPALCQSVLAARDAVYVVDPMRPAVVTVGMLQAGTAPNVIGEVAHAHGTVRTMHPSDRELLLERLRTVVVGTAAAFGCTGELTVAPGEAPLHNDPGLVAAVRARLTGRPASAATDFRSCGSDDFAAYGAGLKDLLNSVSEQMPASRFFITTQLSTPTHDAEIYSLEERARSGGTGPCAFLDLKGRLVPKELKRLETAIAGYKAQVSAACAEVDRCHTDQSGKGWSLKRSDLSDDLNHMNLSGQARWAEHEWTILEAAKLVPAG